MQTLLTENYLGIARSGTDYFSITSEDDSSILMLDPVELSLVTNAVLKGGYHTVDLRESCKLGVRAVVDELSFYWTNPVRDQEATFNRYDFIKFLDADLVRNMAIAFKKAEGQSLRAK